MSKKITLTLEELEKEIRQAFIHGQGNKEMMEAGLERDETEDYVNSRMRILLNQNKEELEDMRVVLLAYHEYLEGFNDFTIYNASESMIDDYLAFIKKDYINQNKDE